MNLARLPLTLWVWLWLASLPSAWAQAPALAQLETLNLPEASSSPSTRASDSSLSWSLPSGRRRARRVLDSVHA